MTLLPPGLAADLATFYRGLHEHPELSLQEFRTADRIASALEPLKVELTQGVGGTGVVAVLRNGAGPVVMMRADFDALPIEEDTGLPYASTARGIDAAGNDVPVMHACGHDMHATALVGALTVLSSCPDSWSGTILAVFQPAEELGRGAKDMIADGLFERFGAPEIVLGQHLTSAPAGQLEIGGGPQMAAADSATVTLYGRGGHSARPYDAVDPVLMAANVVVRLQGIVAREVPPTETAVVTVGRIAAGTKDGVIPATAELGLSVRTYTDEMRTLVKNAVERIVRAEAAAAGAEREPGIDWYSGAPVLTNDPEAAADLAIAFTDYFDPERVLPATLRTASEDVGVFGAALGIPTVFWFLGALGSDSAGLVPHSPEFAPAIEPTLTTGVEALAVAAFHRLGPPPATTTLPGSA